MKIAAAIQYRADDAFSNGNWRLLDESRIIVDDIGIQFGSYRILKTDVKEAIVNIERPLFSSNASLCLDTLKGDYIVSMNAKKYKKICWPFDIEEKHVETWISKNGKFLRIHLYILGVLFLLNIVGRIVGELS